jgi:hypothetical protein
MSTLQNGELLPEHNVFHGQIPTAVNEANQRPYREQEEAQHGAEL